MWQSQMFMGHGQGRVKFLSSGKVNVKLKKFNKFWNTKVSIGHYVSELMRYYTEAEKAKKFSGVSVEATIGTMYFLVLSGFYDSRDLEFQRSIEETRQHWEAHRLSYESLIPLTDEIITSILNVSLNPEEHIHLVFSHSLLFTPSAENFSDLSFTNYFGQQIKVTGPNDSHSHKHFFHISNNPRFCILDCGEFIAAYNFIKSYLQGMGYIPLNILDFFHRKIQEIIVGVRANNFKLAQASLLPLLFMLKNFMTSFPIISYDSMDALIIDLDILRRWPMPYGSAADKTLEIVIKELKSPGNAMRLRIREIFPIIDQHSSVFEGHSVNPLQGIPTTNAYIVLNSIESLESCYFYKITMFKKLYNNDKLIQMIRKIESASGINLYAVQSHVNRCLVVLFTFSLFIELNTTDISHIAGLSSEMIFMIYKKIIQMNEKIDNEDIDRARTLQEWFIMDLFEEVKKLKSDRTSPLTEHLFVYLIDFEIFYPRFPLDNLSIIDLEQSKTDLDVIEESEVSIINRSTLSTSEDPVLCMINQSLASYSFKIPIKIIITGSDVVLHRTLRSFVKAMVKEKNPSNFNLKFYVIPTYSVPNTLAAYLSSIDPWYTRHVYIPFYFRPWVPRLDTKKDLKPKKDSSQMEIFMNSLSIDNAENGGLNEKSIPIAFCEKLLQDYILEANYLIQVNIYRLACYASENTNPDEIIPMALYVDIGVHAAAKKFQDLKPGFKEKKISEIIDSKAFRFQSIALSLQTSQMDLMGKSCGVSESGVKNIYSLTISNVPREQDKCMNSNPQVEWLELTFIEKESVVQENILIKDSKSKKIKEMQSQINIAINSLYSNLHISGGVITANENEGMDIVVDGMLYGPFKKIIVEPWTINGQQLFLPVYIFLDTEA